MSYGFNGTWAVWKDHTVVDISGIEGGFNGTWAVWKDYYNHNNISLHRCFNGTWAVWKGIRQLQISFN